MDWVAQTRGDGLGYDVLSFAPDGRERWIEVKTTNAGPSTPFLISRNELDVWKANIERFVLVRLFRFSAHAEFYEVSGDPESRLDLEPAVWLGRSAQ